MVQPQQEFKHIVRIADVDLPGNQCLRFALTKIKGVGINFADAICALSRIDKQKKTGHLSVAEVTKLTEIIKNPQGKLPTWFFNRRKDYETGVDKHLITGTLNFTTENDLKRLKKIKTLRGIRHIKGLPVRGQRTRSNFRKAKGKVVGVKKAKPAAAAKK